MKLGKNCHWRFEHLNINSLFDYVNFNFEFFVRNFLC